MRSKSLVLLALALGCGLIAAIGINQVMANRGQQVAATEMQPIYVAMKDLPSRETIKVEDLKLEEWPKDKVPRGAITKPEQLGERSAKTKIYTGEPILESKLFSLDDPAMGAAPRIPKGMQVVTIKVDDVAGVSKLILPGDSVDVQVYVRRNESIGVLETVTATVLPEAKVFSVNEIFDGDQSADGEGTMAAKTVSLLVDPSQAKRVMLAAELGKIRLTLRGPDDKTEPDNTIVSIQDLLNPNSKKNTTEDKGDGGGGLLSLLGNSQPEAQPPVAEVAPTPPANLWTMVVLAGADAPRQIQFQDGVRVDQNPPAESTTENFPPEQEPAYTPTPDMPIDEPPPFDPAANVDEEYDRMD